MRLLLDTRYAFGCKIRIGPPIFAQPDGAAGSDRLQIEDDHRAPI